MCCLFIYLLNYKHYVWNGHGTDLEIANVSARQAVLFIYSHCEQSTELSLAVHAECIQAGNMSRQSSLH